MLLRRLLLALIASVAACSQSGLRDGGQDAGRDGGVDAGRDAGRDAGARDAAPEAGTDGSTDPWDPGWVRLPGFPDECGIERAEHPERVVRPFPWEPCPEQPVGCSRAITGWLPTDLGWHDDATGRGYVVTYGDGLQIVDLDRGGIAAWRAPPELDGDPWVCSVHRVGIGDGYGGVYFNFHHYGDEDRSVDQVYHAPLDDIGSTTEPIAVIAPGLISTPQHLAVTRRLVLAELQPVATVVAFAPDRWGAIWSDAVSGIPQEVRGVGDFAFWLDYGGVPRIAYGSLDRPAAWLRDIAPGRIRVFDTDGVDLAWVEIRDSPPSLELWTAPVVFDAADLRPRRVRDVQGIQQNGMGGGWFVLMKRDPERLEIIELATGRTKTWLAPPGYTVTTTGSRPNYVTATEIVFDSGFYWVRLDPRSVPWDE
jgi:hypothetical protein